MTSAPSRSDGDAAPDQKPGAAAEPARTGRAGPATRSTPSDPEGCAPESVTWPSLVGCINGSLNSRNAGCALALVTPHVATPLLAQARKRHTNGIDATYLQSGPETWRIQLRKVMSASADRRGVTCLKLAQVLVLVGLGNLCEEAQEVGVGSLLRQVQAQPGERSQS